MQRIVTKVCWRSWSAMCCIFVLRPFEGQGLNRHESWSQFSMTLWNILRYFSTWLQIELQIDCIANCKSIASHLCCLQAGDHHSLWVFATAACRLWWGKQSKAPWPGPTAQDGIAVYRSISHYRQLKCVLSSTRRSGMIFEPGCVGGIGTVLQRWLNKRALVFWTTIVTRAYGSLVPWPKMSPKALPCSIHSVLTWCDIVSWVSCKQCQGVDHFWDLCTIENARQKGEWKRSPETCFSEVQARLDLTHNIPQPSNTFNIL